MGLSCSKRKAAAAPLTGRVSPFGKFAWRSSQHRRRSAPVDGTLLGASLDAACASLIAQDPRVVRALPPDLAQLLLERLVARGALNDAAVLRLAGQHFYALRLDAFPADIPEFWMRVLATPTLELADLSRTMASPPSRERPTSPASFLPSTS